MESFDLTEDLVSAEMRKNFLILSGIPNPVCTCTMKSEPAGRAVDYVTDAGS